VQPKNGVFPDAHGFFAIFFGRWDDLPAFLSVSSFEIGTYNRLIDKNGNFIHVICALKTGCFGNEFKGMMI